MQYSVSVNLVPWLKHRKETASKTLYEESMLSLLRAAEIKMDGMIQYSSFNFESHEVLCYTKVMHDPLEDKELVQCLHYYIQEVAVYNRKEKDASIVK